MIQSTEMEEYYKEENDKMEKELRSLKKELTFYRGIVYFIAGCLNAILYIFFIFLLNYTVIKIMGIYNILTISDKVAITTLIFAVITILFKYLPKVFNWPEEMYLHSLKKEEERDRLTKKQNP